MARPRTVPSPDNPFVEGEMPELEAPGKFPQITGRTPDGMEVREPQDPHSAQRQAELRMERARRQRAKDIRANPFIDDAIGDPMPRVPMDDPDWAYKFVRDMLPPDFTNPGGADTSNVAAHTFGRLQWEQVRPDMLNAQWQAYYRTLVRQRPGVEGVNAGTEIRYRDVVLMRADRRMRDMQLQAWDYRADQQRMAVDRRMAEAAHQHGARARIDDEENEVLAGFE